MKVLCISRYDGQVSQISEDDWAEVYAEIDQFLEDTNGTRRNGPNGMVNYVTEEEMFLVIPD